MRNKLRKLLSLALVLALLVQVLPASTSEP